MASEYVFPPAPLRSYIIQLFSVNNLVEALRKIINRKNRIIITIKIHEIKWKFGFSLPSFPLHVQGCWSAHKTGNELSPVRPTGSYPVSGVDGINLCSCRVGLESHESHGVEGTRSLLSRPISLSSWRNS